MSKNVSVDGNTFTGVSQVKLNTTSGGTALFKDVDEITTPSGTKAITANGSYDVSDFATAEVNVPTEGSGATLQELTINENGTYTPASGYDGFSQVIANIAASTSGLVYTTGLKTPESGYQLYIPVDTTKGTPFVIMTWSDGAYEAGTVTCGHITVLNTYHLNGVKDVIGFCFINDGTNGMAIPTSNLFNKASGSGYVEGKGYLMDRASASNNLDTSATYNYIVFYKPIGDLTFGGA